MGEFALDIKKELKGLYSSALNFDAWDSVVIKNLWFEIYHTGFVLSQ